MKLKCSRMQIYSAFKNHAFEIIIFVSKTINLLLPVKCLFINYVLSIEFIGTLICDGPSSRISRSNLWVAARRFKSGPKDPDQY
jgi:hypothetical protein